MLVFPDPNDSTEYTDPNGDKWEFNGTGWVRQPDCPDNGGGGGLLEDQTWPLPPAPVVDLLSCTGSYTWNGQYSIDLFKVGAGGSLDLYDRIEFSGMPFHTFANTRPLIAVSVGATIYIYDYSTSPVQLVNTISSPVSGSSSISFSGSDRFIFVNNRRDYAAFREATAGAGDWVQYGNRTRLFDEEAESYADTMGLEGEERLLSHNFQSGTLSSQNNVAGDDEAYFFGHLDLVQNTYDSTMLFHASPTGPALASAAGLRWYQTASANAVGGHVACGSAAHPYAGFAAYGLRGSIPIDNLPLRWNAGIIALSSKSKGISSHLAMTASSDADPNEVFVCEFSPSGNYVAFKERGREIRVYRFYQDGSTVEKIVLPNGAGLTNSGPMQWSADEKYFYLHGWLPSQDPVTGDWGGIFAYEFSESGVTEIGQVATTRSISASSFNSSTQQHTRMQRSKA